MKTLRNVFIFLAFAALPFTGGVSFASAQALSAIVSGANAAGPDCTITKDDTAAIAAAAQQSFAAELDARRTLLVRVITCAETDAQTLRSVLQSTTAPDDVKSFQGQLSDKLGDTVNFYNIELGKVSDAGIAETKVIAGEVLAWRTGTYAPLSGEVNNFILWTSNQALFNTANNRLTQTGVVVSFLEEAGPQTDLRDAYAAAQVLISRANDENAAAKNALLQFLPPDQSLALIQESLQSLSDAYQKFSDINTIVQTLLPTTSK